MNGEPMHTVLDQKEYGQVYCFASEHTPQVSITEIRTTNRWLVLSAKITRTQKRTQVTP